jgi:hypothetical protein
MPPGIRPSRSRWRRRTGRRQARARVAHRELGEGSLGWYAERQLVRSARTPVAQRAPEQQLHDIEHPQIASPVNSARERVRRAR